MKRALGLLALLAPAFLGAAHGARGQRHEPPDVSRLVFPEAGRGLRFDHAAEPHRRLACARCHTGAADSERADDSLAPSERTCTPCHAAEVDRRGATAERCGTCHLGARDGNPPRVPVVDHPTPRIRFSHRAHTHEGMRCLDCHAGVTDAGSGERHLPGMQSCFRCHGGASPAASTSCTTCHLMLPDGRMRSSYPEGWMNPPEWLFGMRHDADWLVRHRWVAADQGDACATCHTESDCTDCHDGRVRPPRVHPNDWLTVHAPMARRDSPRCTSCHTTQTFCSECHARLGTSLVAAPNVRASARFHPPAAVWIRGPVLHAREAQRSMTTCTSCHAERDCIMCHGALGVGAGISPHPPGFRSDCGRLLRANDRACRACHGDVAPLRAMCD